MQSRKSVKSAEESLAKRILETSDGKIMEVSNYVGLKETCPFQDQSVIEVHCRTDCAWYSHDDCIVWDIASMLRQISGDLSCIQSQTEKR